MFYRPLVFLLSLALFIGGAASAAWATTVDKTPDRTITVIPSPSNSAAVSGVAVASNGTTYVTKYDPANSTRTLVYAVDAAGVATPILEINAGSFPSNVVVGADGRLYIINFNAGVYVYDLNGTSLGLIPADNNPYPPSELYTPQDLGVDASGKVYVTDSGRGNVYVFAAGTTTNVAPIATIPVGGTPFGIDVQPDGSFWMVDQNQDSVEYWAPSGGTHLLQKTISGANTGLTNPYDVELAVDGKITVSQDSFPGKISFFASTANGNIAPETVWTGPGTGLSSAYFMNYGPCGELFVATGASSLIQIFGTCPPSPSPSVSPTQATLPSTSAVEVNSTQLWLGVGIALSGVLLGWLSLSLKRKTSK
jgi:YVTN family beta-propeller protein